MVFSAIVVIGIIVIYFLCQNSESKAVSQEVAQIRTSLSYDRTGKLLILKSRTSNNRNVIKAEAYARIRLWVRRCFKKSEAGKCPRGLCWKQSVICWTANRRTLSSSGGTLNKRVCQRKGQRCFLNENRVIMAGFEAVFNVQ